METSDKKHMYSVYQRIKDNCCAKWSRDSASFYIWYKDRINTQNGLCEYCNLPGDTTKNYRNEGFRKGRRGFRLEVDRKNPKGKYSPNNCVLACYPCNNAKSDVFTYAEFILIGKAIGEVKNRKLQRIF